MARYNRSNSKKKGKKYSLSERIDYYGSKLSKSEGKEYAFALGYIDSATECYIDSSKFNSDADKTAYHKGVDRGNRALYKSKNVKF